MNTPPDDPPRLKNGIHAGFRTPRERAESRSVWTNTGQCACRRDTNSGIGHKSLSSRWIGVLPVSATDGQTDGMTVSWLGWTTSCTSRLSRNQYDSSHLAFEISPIAILKNIAPTLAVTLFDCEVVFCHLALLPAEACRIQIQIRCQVPQLWDHAAQFSAGQPRQRKILGWWTAYSGERSPR